VFIIPLQYHVSQLKPLYPDGQLQTFGPVQVPTEEHTVGEVDIIPLHEYASQREPE
jgi:primase-polymerase (primpol)-like protein